MFVVLSGEPLINMGPLRVVFQQVFTEELTHTVVSSAHTVVVCAHTVVICVVL